MKKYLLMFPVLILSLFVGLHVANAQSAPFITISASPTSVAYGGTTTITYTVASATACTGTSSPSTLGWNNNSKATSGGYFYSGTLTTTTVFTLNCTNQYGSMTKSVTVSVGPNNGGGGGGSAPIVTVNANPTTISSGSSSVVSWSAPTATSCTISGWYGNMGAPNGSKTVYPTSTTTYTVTCTNSYGSGFGTVTVYVNNVPPPQVPTVNITANPTSVVYGGSSTLSWSSTNATYCTSTGGTNGWSGNQNTNGNFSLSNLTYSTVFAITCYNANGQSASNSVTISVGNQPYNPPTQTPTVNIVANPTSVAYGGNSTISWSSTNATSCSATGGSNGWAGNKAISGTFAAYNLTNPQTVFAVTCTGSGGSASDSVTVYVASLPPPQIPTVTITANPNSVSYNGSSTITWNSSNATSCSASGNGWSGAKGVSGSLFFNNLTAMTTYTIVCTGNGGSASDSVNVYVGQAPLAPTVNISADKNSLQNNGSTNIRWTTTGNPTYCSATGGSNGWAGSKSINGGVFPTSQLDAGTYTYSITCGNNNGDDSDTTTIVVDQKIVNAPVISLFTDFYNNYTNLRWTVTDATSCVANSNPTTSWKGLKNSIAGQQIIYDAELTQKNTYFNLHCTGPGGVDDDTVVITLDQQSQNPTVNITANPIYVPYNGQSTVTWNSNNATSCSATGGSNGWSGYKSISGSFQTGNLTYNTTYSITCNGTGGQANDTITITVGSAPSQNLNVNTYTASNINENAATLNGYVNSDNNSYITRWFEWGTSFGNLYNKTNSINGEGNFNQYISGLNANTTYYYRAVAQNGTGNTVYGTVQNFSTTGGYIYNNTCNNGYNNCIPNATTTLATNISTNSARLNGFGSQNSNSISLNGYFEWGTTLNLGNTTQSGYIGNTNSNPFYSSLFNLSPNTTYYYRAVITNQYGTARGEIKSFRTNNVIINTNTRTIVREVVREVPVVVTQPTVTPINVVQPNGISKASLIFLTVNSNGNFGQNENVNYNGNSIQRGELVDYVVYYKNISQEQLGNVILRVSLPSELSFVSTTRGYLSDDNNTVILNIGNLFPNEEGSITVKTRVSNTVDTGKIVVVTGNIPYTILTSNNPINTINNQEEVFAYAKDTVGGGEVLGVQGLALFGNGFWPSTLIGWLILLIVILLIILIARTIYSKMTKPTPIVVNTPPNNINHYH